MHTVYCKNCHHPESDHRILGGDQYVPCRGFITSDGKVWPKGRAELCRCIKFEPGKVIESESEAGFAQESENLSAV